MILISLIAIIRRWQALMTFNEQSRRLNLICVQDSCKNVCNNFPWYEKIRDNERIWIDYSRVSSM